MGAIPGSGLSLGTLWIAIAASVDEAEKALQRFGQDTSALIEEQKKKWDGLKDVGQSLKGIGLGLTTAITAPLVGVGAAAVKLAEDLNTARTSFTTMLGSGEAAEKMLKELQQFAATTPFEFPDLVEAARRMNALGVESSQVIPWLKTIGDTAAAMGGGKDVIDGITLALAQMTAKGKVSAEEMNQLAERGVPAWKILADAIGVSVPEAMKMAETGAIRAAEAVPAILDGMNQKFGGSMEQLSKTLTGQWSNFKDQVTLALIPIGQALIPALQSLLQILTPVIAAVGDAARWFQALPDPVQNAVIAIGALAAAIGPILLVAGQLIIAFTAVAPALASAGTAISGLISALGPLAAALAGPPGWIAAITAALVALGVWIYSNWDAIVATLTGAWAGIQQAWTSVWTAITGAVIGVWETFKSAVEPAWKFIVDLVSSVWNVVTAIWEAEWKLIIGAVKAIWDAIEPYVRAVLGPVVEFLSDLWNAIERLWDKVWGGIEKAVTDTWDAIAKAAKTVFSPAVKFLKDVWDDLKQIWSKVWTGIEDMLTKLWDRLAGAAKAAWEQIAKIGNIITGIPQKLNNLATSIRNVGNEADKAAGHSPIPELNEALEETDAVLEPLPGEIDELAASITALGNAAAAAHADVNFSADWTALQTGAANAATAVDTLRAAIYNLDTVSVPAHANLNFSADFSAIQSGATTAAGAIGGLQGAVDTLDTQGSADFRSFAGAAGTAKTDVNTAVGDMSREVSTIITNLAQDISKSLWEGEGSWAEKGLNALRSLGEAVTSQFIAPFTTAIATFISGALADLLGKTGLGGVLDAIRNIGKSAGDVVSGAGGAGGAGGGAGTGGGAGGASGGIAGIANIAGAIGSVVNAISGIISGIKTEKDFDTLINHTLRIYNELEQFRKDAWDREGHLMRKLDDMWGSLLTTMDNTGVIREAVQAVEFHINEIGADIEATKDTLWSILQTGERANARQETQLDRMLTIFEQMSGKLDDLVYTGRQQVTVLLTGSDPTAVATKLAQQLRLQGALT